jgi:lipoyl(octanoyl) transferase
MKTLDPVQWSISGDLVPYADAVRSMEERVTAIASGRVLEQVWLLEHPPLYTAGTSAKDCDLLEAQFPVFRSGRGGQFTYHGPGQRVGYVMLDLNRRGRDVRRFVRHLEEWLIIALATLGVRGERRSGRVGIWVPGTGGREDKIAAIGVPPCRTTRESFRAESRTMGSASPVSTRLATTSRSLRPTVLFNAHSSRCLGP